MSGSKTPRRKFLQLAVAAAAPVVSASCSRGRNPFHFLTAAEARTLAAVCERIIPSDQDSGAASAGVVYYIDRQLCGRYRRHQKAYRAGLVDIDRASATRFSRAFSDLSALQADRLLTAIENSVFFRLVVAHTMQGFYGDPRHGGNIGAVSWRMLGVPPVPIRGRRTFEAHKS